MEGFKMYNERERPFKVKNQQIYKLFTRTIPNSMHGRME